VALLDKQSGVTTSQGGRPKSDGPQGAHGWAPSIGKTTGGLGDTGGASRFFPTFEHDPFFYTAKAPAAEREIGLGHRKRRKVNDGRATEIDNAYQRGESKRANTHPTVKPIDVMRWLCRLVTPRGGLVLDPFLGSGTTAIAATRERFRVIGIEREAEYIEIARDRIMGDAPLLNSGSLFGVPA
jgi:site-specific DNA-methyltransferase (adenine-specific)